MREIQFVSKLNTARNTARPKLDLRLTTLAELGEEAYAEHAGTLEAGRSSFRRSGALAFLRGTSRDGLESGTNVAIQAFITVTERAAFDRIGAVFNERNLKIQSTAGNIGTAEIPLETLCDVEAHSDVLAIEWAGAFRPTSGPVNEKATRSPRAAISADSLPSSLDGKGVLVGVVDGGGLDLYHPDFSNNRGITSVRALWDQRAPKPIGQIARPGNLPQRGYGVVHDFEAVDYELHPKQRRRYSVVSHQALKESHGTATAGLAVGLGTYRPEARGIAPGARLVFVDTFGSGSGTLGAMTELADALAFIFAVADADKKPCVINVSLGDDIGPRDGTLPVERFIDALADKPGRAIVVAAGNSAEKRRHLTVQFDDNGNATLEIDVGADNEDNVGIEIWHDATTDGSGSLEIEIEAPQNGGRTPTIESDGKPRAFDVEATRILVAGCKRVPIGENGLFRIDILPTSEMPLVDGIWKIHLHAKGGIAKAHACIDHRYVCFAKAHATESQCTLTSPGTSRSAITVGAYDLKYGEPTFYSSLGPCRNGTGKPDIYAPGGPLIAPSASTPRLYSEFVNGTSVAAPLVAGAVALLFQRFGPDLNRETILSLLTNGATLADAKSGVPLVSLAALRAEKPAASPHLESTTSQSAAAPKPATFARDGVQIMVGEYILYQIGIVVGHLVVTEGRSRRETIEHWIFQQNYRPPSRNQPRASLTFEHTGCGHSINKLLKRFGKDATYIRAVCTAQVHNGNSFSSNSNQQPNGNKLVSIERNKMEKRYPTRPGDGVQIMVGEYVLKQGEATVGKLYVEELSGPSHTKEHWLLHEAYRWPSSTNTNQEIVFEYTGELGGLSRFLENPPSNSAYIIADCTVGSFT